MMSALFLLLHLWWFGKDLSNVHKLRFCQTATLPREHLFRCLRRPYRFFQVDNKFRVFFLSMIHPLYRLSKKNSTVIWQRSIRNKIFAHLSGASQSWFRLLSCCCSTLESSPSKSSRPRRRRRKAAAPSTTEAAPPPNVT